MEKNNNKLSIIALVFAIIAALVSFYTCYSTDKLCNIFSNEETESVQTITSAGEVIDEPATIDDVLQFRRDTKEYERYDSIFMNMPDVALIAILMKGGTNMSNSDIAKEYLSNRKDYDNVEFGAQINDTYKQNKITPDSIPRKSTADIPIKDE